MWEHEQDGSASASARQEREASPPEEQAQPDLWLWLPQVIPQALWKCWAIGIASAIGFLGLLTAWHFAEQASTAGSVPGDLLAPFLNRLLLGSGAVAWLIAAQLCCLAWWVRSRSRVDYGGRFYAWGWTAAGFFTASLLCLTDAHRLVAALVLWSVAGSVTDSAGMTALWLLPLLVAGLVLWANLGAEFRNDFASRVLHALGAVCALTLIGLELWNSRTGNTEDWEFVSRLLLASLQWCHLMSVWLHVRHVVHVSADPPTMSASGWLLAWRYGPGRAASWLSERTTTKLVEPVAESLDGTALAVGKKQLREADGSSKEVRIDDAEPTPKGPTRRVRETAKKK
ncbi:MAG: hypothetical protein IAG10_23705 [Planctomycetaceae bacterium]|nr:hypothetical protein [Planctomycetaceae bacterium]